MGVPVVHGADYPPFIRHLSAIVNVADKPKPAFPSLIRHPPDWRKAEALRERKFNAALARWLAPAPSNPIAERLFARRSQDSKRRFRTFTAVAPLRNKCPGSIEAGACLFNYSARRNNPTQNSCAALVMLANILDTKFHFFSCFFKLFIHCQ